MSIAIILSLYILNRKLFPNKYKTIANLYLCDMQNVMPT